MDYEILNRPSYSLLKLYMKGGESIEAEAGAMVSMSQEIEIETSAKGGVFGALKRNILGGESFFINKFKAIDNGELLLAPALPGDMARTELKGKTIYVQSGSYIASSNEINVNTKWGGAKTFFSKEGLFLLKISGTGNLFISSFGAIHEIELEEGQKYTVDTGHMVAFEEGVNYTVKRVGGLKSTLFSGEGLVVELTGPGKIMIQSRSTDSFLSWLIPKLPEKS